MDKLRTWISPYDYKINSNFKNYNWQKEPPRPVIDLKTNEITERGREKTYLKTDNLVIDFHEGGLIATTNPNNIFGKKNKNDFDFQDWTQTVVFLKEKLHQYGIESDICQHKLSRTDWKFDIPTDNSYSEYSPIVKTIIGNMRNSKIFMIEGTKYVKNKTETIRIYDSQFKHGFDSPTIRLEHELDKAVRLNLTVGSVDAKQFQRIRTNAINKIETNVFKFKPLVVESEYLRAFITLCEQRPFNANNVLYGFVNLVVTTEGTQKGIDVWDIIKVPSQLFGERNPDYEKINRFIRKAKNQYIFTQKHLQLFDELYNKFKEVI